MLIPTSHIPNIHVETKLFRLTASNDFPMLEITRLLPSLHETVEGNSKLEHAF